MNKVYSSKEIARIFYLVHEVEYFRESIPNIDCYDDLLGALLLNLEGRIIGDELLLKKDVGSVVDPDIAIDDYQSYEKLTWIVNDKQLDDESFELIFDKDCMLLVEKRLEAFKKLYYAIEDLRKAYREDSQ